MGDQHAPPQFATAHGPANAPVASSTVGKQTLTQHLPAAPVANDPTSQLVQVAARAGKRVTDAGQFAYLVRDDGCFEVVAAPRAFTTALHRVIGPVGPYGMVWATLAERIVREPLATPAAPAAAPAQKSTLAIALAKADADKSTRYERPSDAQKTDTPEVKKAMRAYSNAFAARLASGNASVDAFYCSGFSIWTLAAAGHDVTKPLAGKDGVLFTYTGTTPARDRRGRPIVDDGHPVMQEVSINLRDLLDGHPDAVEVANIVATWPAGKGGSVGPLKGTGHSVGHNHTGEAMDDALGIKGAAAAFVIAGIGVEVPERDQKPGDFAQARWKKPGAANHEGAGHAWQVVSVTASGSAMFGQPGSPRAMELGLTGWHTTTFTIDQETDPQLVGAHRVLGARRVEANTKGSGGGVHDATDQDGGIHLTVDVAVPDQGKAMHYIDYTVYYGRLAGTPWSGWRPATPPAP